MFPKVAFVVAIVIFLGLVGYAAKIPLLFASIGPTLVMVVSNPLTKTASPRAIFGGHVIAIGVALFSLFIFGLYGAPSVLVQGINWERIGAVTLAMAVNTVIEEKTLFRHPPSSATLLLVALGIMYNPIQIAALIVGVAIMASGAMGLRALVGSRPPQHLLQ